MSAPLQTPPEPEIEAAVLAQLEALPLDPGRPLLAVDADEVLVHLAEHLARFVYGLGYEMRLTRYRLDGAVRRRDTGEVVAFADTLALIDRFFHEEAHAQQAIEGAAEALARLSVKAQVMVLTNVPRHARETRIANLAGLGMGYPLVENSGGKGRALAWMAARVAGPVVFIDDSPNQIVSAARYAPEVVRVHFVGAPYVTALIPEVGEAHHRVASWAEAEPVLAAALG
ncbi:MAG: hypothetical protein AAGI34_17600 [Pseudomonadota bacterium]